jgi:hypothetical protein
MTEIDQYFEAFRRRLPSAERVAFKEIGLRDGSWPIRNKCHDNVDAWVLANPHYRAVRGWVVTGGHILDAHSVICDQRGKLWDITFPDLAAVGFLFIRHRGTDEQFFSVRTRRAQHIFL